ncbi:MBL fold metallo-hydrolase [Paucibacter sp. APW11]|uniref:MBL fold metallo-hydrolase n=1 Tax=Roseateles aquae TaxID=3077235 RepID=A0ABU3PDK4_9BURK|nr:MBL fold metallo-hydrolase [Paucibacter sp. APW11]MDT9000683.1 MBL fold metallo-hydrolase [Paucibacter sp. APW11]
MSTLPCHRPPLSAAHRASAQHRQGRFHNAQPRHPMSWQKTLGLLWRFITDKPAEARPRQALPVQAISQADLLAAPDQSLYRLGHSTVLLKLDGRLWLTDPVFSERASPLSWLGPKRFHAPPISIAELPAIAGVILSHDHFDHLDRAAIRQLAPKVEHFITPLGVGQRLIRWGVPAAKVRELDWWQSTQIGGLRLTATPAQHYSGRGLSDGNQTLWASFVLESAESRVFFSGDSGYFDGFRAIGQRFGGFDLSLIETGAYDRDWPDVHMQPHESLQAHLDLGGRVLLPIHNGTFDLGLHDWHEPFERINALASQHDVALSLPQIGERVSILVAQRGGEWWRARLGA